MSKNSFERSKYTKLVPEEEKKSKGRPRKYERKVVIDDQGKETLVLEEIDKRRYFFVSYNWIYLNTIKWGYITFEMAKDKMFSIGDIQKITGIQNIVPFSWIEFASKKDFIEFQGKNIVDYETLTVE